MIPRIKAHLPIASVISLSALVTFSILWMRDVVRIEEPISQAAALPTNPAINDPAIEKILTAGDSIDPAMIEGDLQMLELSDADEALMDIQELLGNQ
jgi:hypothetical protein